MNSAREIAKANALRSSQDRCLETLDTLQDGIWVCELDGTPLYRNPVAAAMEARVWSRARLVGSIEEVVFNSDNLKQLLACGSTMGFNWAPQSPSPAVRYSFWVVLGSTEACAQCGIDELPAVGVIDHHQAVADVIEDIAQSQLALKPRCLCLHACGDIRRRRNPQELAFLLQLTLHHFYEHGRTVFVAVLPDTRSSRTDRRLRTRQTRMFQVTGNLIGFAQPEQACRANPTVSA